MLLEEGHALLQVLAAQAPPVVEAVQRVQPGHQDEVQALACTPPPLELCQGAPEAQCRQSMCEGPQKVREACIAKGCEVCATMAGLRRQNQTLQRWWRLPMMMPSAKAMCTLPWESKQTQ